MSDQLGLFAPTVKWRLGEYWSVRPVNSATADAWFGNYHYSGDRGHPGGVSYGVFAGDAVALVATAPATNPHGVAKRYGLEEWPGNHEIVRVAVHPDAPRNTASRAVAMVCRTVAESRGKEWLFSYADTGQDHHGGIYQALNAVYVGVSAACHGFRLNGKPLHPRVVVIRYGTKAWPAVRELAALAGDVLERIEGMNTAKHTYILPIGPPASRRAIRQQLQPHAKPYPKRDQAHRQAA